MMSKYLSVIVENGGAYELHRFDIGKTLHDYSTVEFSVMAPEARKLDLILDNLVSLGCHLEDWARSCEAVREGRNVPRRFYSTTN